MELKHFIFMVSLVALASTMFFNFVYDVTDEYNQEVPDEYKETLNAFNESTALVLDTAKGLEDAALKVEEGAILGGALTGGGAVLKFLLLPFNMIGDLNNFIWRAGQLIGVPKFILLGLYTVILTMIGFLFIEAVLRFRKA